MQEFRQRREVNVNQDFYCLHSDLCKTLANEKRQRILGALRDKELTVSQLVEAVGMSQANTSQHLSILRSKGVVTSRREGAHIYYAIGNPKIIQAFDLITEVMQENLAAQNRNAGALGE
ncbi:MAG: winged helix-turn-helix transcriptional regulator [Coriobacteriia bacterium]|nr:winged helix-turn-helix transcriptional regulator [Coriobacteriia bacterium]MBN2823658.1 winged helix-turn-helix transcriptional regulator [Coriobacteriia bacterium]